MEKHVVSCFLENQGKILLLKRSTKVRSFQNKWAGVSGYIEGDERPYDRALIEIEEEVNLSQGDLEFITEGEVIKDEPWVIHPFLFKTSRRDIKLDWEHEEYRWIDPEEIDNFDGVPNLSQELRSLRGV